MVTTIQLSEDLKEKIASFGSKGETYEKILRRIYGLAVKTQLREFLMSDENCISLDEFEKEVEKKWPITKSK
jgi:negative regulator of replication initiation